MVTSITGVEYTWVYVTDVNVPVNVHEVRIMGRRAIRTERRQLMLSADNSRKHIRMRSPQLTALATSITQR